MVGPRDPVAERAERYQARGGDGIKGSRGVWRGPKGICGVQRGLSKDSWEEVLEPFLDFGTDPVGHMGAREQSSF